MSKLKIPCLSLGAHGSVGEVISFTERRGQKIAEKKPHLPYFMTLPVRYQRWLYEDYAHLWTEQSAATKRQYAGGGVRFHLTGFQYWMKYHLKNLPDIAAIWRLDETAGNIAHDSGPYLTDGTIFGATPIIGRIAGAQYFTLNDYIWIVAPQLNFTSEDFSLVAKVYITDLTASRELFIRGGFNADGWYCFFTAAGRFWMQTNQAAANQQSSSVAGSITPNAWYTVGFSRAAASVRIFIEGADATFVAGAHLDPKTSARSAKIGIYDNMITFPMEGIIDHLIIYERALSQPDHARWALRRYP